jgi:hypothetical protein
MLSLDACNNIFQTSRSIEKKRHTKHARYKKKRETILPVKD